MYGVNIEAMGVVKFVLEAPQISKCLGNRASHFVTHHQSQALGEIQIGLCS